MEFSQNINWFPGHMAKAKKELKESLKLVDLTAELVDSRIPISSRNKELTEMCGEKPRILVLNKSDLLDKHAIYQWLDFFKKQDLVCLPYSFRSSASRLEFIKYAKEVMKDKLETWKLKGMVGRKIRIMVLGIPNVGKSTFINSLLRSSKAKVENRPGVTRKNQWFSLGSDIELLDTPGVLWPKLEDKSAAYNLAITGAIKDSILDIEDLACHFIEKIKNEDFICERYKLEVSDMQKSPHDILSLIGKKRGMLSSGGIVNTFRAAEMLLEEFRLGKLGRIMLEKPEI